MDRTGSGGSFARLLRNHRLRAGLTQEALAHGAGVSVRALSDLERGRVRRPHGHTVELLVKVLGLPAGQAAALLAAAREIDTEPEAPAAEPVRQLPPDCRDFTGRADEIEQLRQAVRKRRPETVLAIVGMGGVGKTVLAVRAGYEFADAYPDGQLYLDLRGFEPRPLTLADALARLLRGLGVPDDRTPVEVDDQLNLYRSRIAGRRFLLLLDNARDETQVRPLLPSGAGNLALVTSRSLLTGLDGARGLVLEAMPDDDAHALLRDVVSHDRATADPEATQTVVRLCGNLPLALRIAGARLAARPHWTMAEFATRLRDRHGRLSELAAGDRSLPAVFELSYRALSDPDRQLFRRLAVLPGAFRADTAGALAAGAGPATAGLERLVDASLAQAVGDGRYQLHDLVRLYAGDRLTREEPDPAEVTVRMLHWHAATTRAAIELVSPAFTRLPMPPGPARLPVATFADQRQALAYLDAERQNLAAVVGVAADSDRPAYAWVLMDAWRGYFYLRRYLSEWLANTEAALAVAQAHDDPSGQAAMHLSLGLAHKCAGDYPRAAEAYDRAMRASQAAGWPAGEAAATGNLGVVRYYLGRFDEARAAYRRAIEVNRAEGNRGGEAIGLANLAAVDIQMDHLDAAAASCREVVDIYRQIGSISGLTVTLATLSNISLRRGDPVEAHRLVTEALDAAGSAGIWRGSLAVAHAAALLALDRPAEAATVAARALRASHATGDRQIQIDLLNVVAEVHARNGRTAQAVHHYERAQRRGREIGLLHAPIEALLGLAALHRAAGRPDDAAAAARQASELAHAAGHRLYERLAREAADAAR